MAEIKKKERLIGLDVLRILSMLLITIRHYIHYSELTALLDCFTVNGVVIRFLDVFCGSAVNIFVLISGYFLSASGFKRKKALMIWGETFFYSVICFAVAVVFGLEKITAGKLLLSFAPIVSRHYWFTVAYLAVYAVSPFLNKMVGALSEKEYTGLIAGGALLLSAWTSLVFVSAGVVTGGSTGLLWFCYLYLVGGYFKKYPEKLPKKNICWLIVVLMTGILLVFSFMREKITLLDLFPLLEDDSITELLLSVALFGAFLQIRIKSGLFSKLVVSVAACSFGVYLIQESCMIRQWLWYSLVQGNTITDRWYLLPVGLLVALCLFVLAWIGHKIYKLLVGVMEKSFNQKKTV